MTTRMAKNQSAKQAPVVVDVDVDVNDVTQNIMTETTQTTPRSAVKPMFSPDSISELISFKWTSDSQKSARLQLTQHEGWDMMNDKSGTSITQTSAGVKALLKVAEGMIWGIPTFIVTAPPEKYLAKRGSGTYGYVSHLHDPQTDVFSFEYDGNEHVVSIKPEMVPTAKGWYRVTVDAGELMVTENEPLRDLNFNNGWSYHYCETLAAIMDGANVSLSLGPKTIPDGLKVMDLVVDADDPVAGVGTFRWTKRELGRAYNARNQHAEDIAHAVENGEEIASDSAELIVPLVQGGTTSLASWNSQVRVPIYSDMGLSLGSLKIAADTMPARLAVARTIVENGYLVKLS